MIITRQCVFPQDNEGVKDHDLVDENDDSDREKYSGTDSDDEQAEEEEKPATPKASPKAAEVRKRKARKAE